MGSEVVKMVTAEAFTYNADQLMEKALDTLTPSTDALAAAQGVIDQLDKVDTGRLAVKPPLTSEQISHYSTAAHAVITSTERALVGLDWSRRGRKRLARLALQSMETRIANPKATHKPGASFQGNAAGLKS
jgi:hypothetical protein